MSRKSARRRPLTFIDADLDLVPMIDCIFLILLFFMLCGHITLSEREEQISVPPATMANRPPDPTGWRREVLNVLPPSSPGSLAVTLAHGSSTSGLGEAEARMRLRALLDALHDHADTYADPAGSGRRLPQVIIVLRADGDVPFRTLQTLQQLLADSIDPESGLPRARGASARPFPTLEFTTRDPSAQ
jgi:biopolymer transport protein ExbD